MSLKKFCAKLLSFLQTNIVITKLNNHFCCENSHKEKQELFDMKVSKEPLHLHTITVYSLCLDMCLPRKTKKKKDYNTWSCLYYKMSYVI